MRKGIAMTFAVVAALTITMQRARAIQVRFHIPSPILAPTRSKPPGTQRCRRSPAVIGYGRVQPASSTTPAGVAIIGYRQNGVLVSEAGVPA